uniref:Cadherin domain-containing protein n=1 Tax=Denticeps clupeoides TaxID=299321 RepID=A0AAY4DMY1_9TELE
MPQPVIINTHTHTHTSDSLSVHSGVMMVEHLLLLTLLISGAHGIALEDMKGPLDHKVLDIPEATPVPYAIFQFTSAKADVNGYRLSGDSQGVAISDDGWLYLTKPLDWEQQTIHHLEIEALIDDEPVDGPYSVALNVLDVNDHAPVFSQDVYSGEVMEHSLPGVQIVKVSAFDDDNPETPHAELNFSIISQIPNTLGVPLFQINGQTGEISTTPAGVWLIYGAREARGSSDVLRKKFEDFCGPVHNVPYDQNPFFTCVERAETLRLDALLDPDYYLIVRVEDLGGGAENALSSTAWVNIAVRQNLWVNPGPIVIKENFKAQYPMLIGTVTSNDQSAMYRLTQKEREIKFPFLINPAGEIYVTEELDREEKATYVLVVFAEDEQGVLLESPMEILITVQDENDNAPKCGINVFEVQENELVGSAVGKLNVHDADDEETTNALLTYTLLSQDPPPNKFRVDTVTGNILVATAGFSLTHTPQYTLRVLVKDGAPGSPAGRNLWFVLLIYGTITLSEDEPLGTAVVTIKATDADDPGTGSSKVEYHVVAGDPGGVFAVEVDEVTGEGRLVITQPLDFETTASYRLQIDARNPEPLVSGVEYDERATTFVTVEILDVDEPPVFDMDVLEVTVPENLTVGATVLKMVAKDPEGREILFKLEGDERGWLQMDSSSGELKTKQKLDFEEARQLSVRVVAYEKNAPEKQAERDVSIQIVDVNDNIPQLVRSQAFICTKERKPVVLSARDADSAPYGEPFTFALGLKKERSNNWELKAVDGTSATLHLKKAPPSDQTLKIPISIKDNAGMGVTHLFEVRVCNCTELGYCYTEPGTHRWKYSLSTTIGILGGTFAFISEKRVKGRGARRNNLFKYYKTVKVGKYRV